MAYTIHSPAEGFTGITEFGSGSIAFNDGEATVDDLHPGVRAYMESRGYTVEEHEDGPFNPSEHSVKRVRAHIEDAEADEVERVLIAETEGKARKGILDLFEANPDGQPDVKGGGDDDGHGSESDPS